MDSSQLNAVAEGQVAAVKPVSKWKSLGQRVSRLKDGKSFVIEIEGNPYDEAARIRNGLRRMRSCSLIRRSVKVVEGKIVITRLGTIRPLAWIDRAPQLTRFPNLAALFSS